MVTIIKTFKLAKFLGKKYPAQKQQSMFESQMHFYGECLEPPYKCDFSFSCLELLLKAWKHLSYLKDIF